MKENKYESYSVEMSKVDPNTVYICKPKCFIKEDVYGLGITIENKALPDKRGHMVSIRV